MIELPKEWDEAIEEDEAEYAAGKAAAADLIAGKAVIAAMNADKLGEAKARAKRLRDEIKVIEDLLIDHSLETGETKIDGYAYSVSISRFDRAVPAWKKIAMDLGATARKIAANTKISATTRVAAHAHKG